MNVRIVVPIVSIRISAGWPIASVPAGRLTLWRTVNVRPGVGVAPAGCPHRETWSRKLVASVVHDVQSDDLAAVLVDEACRREHIEPGRLVLHSDNGAAMKGKTMLVKLEELGVVPSFSRAACQRRHPFPEALFRILKYRPSYPERPLATVEDAHR